MEIIRRLDDVCQSDVRLVGGKAANLGELIRMGLQVPRGFVITTDCYVEQTSLWKLNDELSRFLAREDWNGTEAAAKSLINSRELDRKIQSDVIVAYRAMGTPDMAVRSSAAGEDSLHASFAGQHETLLNIRGDEDLIRAIKRCWASLWNYRALQYRRQNSLDHISSAMAVIVQEMVSADKSGVMFTCDPVTQRSDRVLVTIGPGLGNAIVSGTTAGDTYRLDRDSLKLVEFDGSGEKLTPKMLTRLSGYALEIEKHFGRPQDIEFAIKKDEVFYLQTRPMTAMDSISSEFLPPLDKPSMVDRIMKPIAAERYVMAPRPLDNITFTRFVGAVIYSIRQSGGVITEENEKSFRAQIWRQAYRVPATRLTWRTLFPWHARIRVLKRDWQAWWDRGPHDELCSVTAPVDLDDLGHAELLVRADRILAVWEKSLNQRFYATTAVAAESWLRSITTLAVGFKRTRELHADLMSGLQSSTTIVNESLWKLSRKVRNNPTLLSAIVEMDAKLLQETPAGRDLIRSFNDFISEHGHREGSCYYLSTPTWRHDPTLVWRILKCLAEVDEHKPTNSSGGLRFSSARELVIRRLRFYPGLTRFFTWLLERLRALQQFRENSHYDLTRALAALQDIAVAWGQRLVKRGALDTIDDVYYLTHSEVRSWLTESVPNPEDSRLLIKRRRITYRTVNGQWQADRSAGTPLKEKLKGTGASPGVVQGFVRIIESERQFDCLRPGEVLVCPYSNPAWTPLFASALAIVSETGGIASHAAIVAREYGLPAVLGATGVLQLLKNGDSVLVDGDRGLVEKL